MQDLMLLQGQQIQEVGRKNSKMVMAVTPLVFSVCGGALFKEIPKTSGEIKT